MYSKLIFSTNYKKKDQKHKNSIKRNKKYKFKI